jgi:hypothetical protein
MLPMILIRSPRLSVGLSGGISTHALLSCFIIQRGEGLATPVSIIFNKPNLTSCNQVASDERECTSISQCNIFRITVNSVASDPPKTFVNLKHLSSVLETIFRAICICSSW